MLRTDLLLVLQECPKNTVSVSGICNDVIFDTVLPMIDNIEFGGHKVISGTESATLYPSRALKNGEINRKQ